MGFFDEVLGDLGEVAAKIAMATHELLENVMKYSSAPNVRLAIDVQGEPGGVRAVSIRVWNHATEEQIAALRNVIDHLRSAPDPQAVYRELMLRPSARADSGGIGLGRIMAEADMTLACTVEGSRVCIEARTIVPPR